MSRHAAPPSLAARRVIAVTAAAGICLSLVVLAGRELGEEPSSNAHAAPSSSAAASGSAERTPTPIFTEPAPDQPQPWSPEDGPLLAPDPSPTADVADRPSPPAGRASRPAPVPTASRSADQEDVAAGERSAPPAPPPLVADQSGLLELVNRDRAAAGCGPVTPHPDLERQAQQHADRQATADSMHHSNGPTGFDHWGENVAYGYADAAEVHGGWMSSPSHRDNVLNCDWRWIGAAHADSPTGVRYWTEQFAA